MKDRKLSMKTVVALLLSLIVLTALTSWAAWSSLSFSTVIEDGSMVSEASYIVVVDGSTYYARNGETGEIDYSGTNASLVVQNALDNSIGRVHLAAGEYTDFRVIIESDNHTLTGEGYATKISATDSFAGLAAIIHCLGTSGDHLENIGIERLHILGSVSAANQCGIWFQYVDNSYMDRCWIEDVGYDAYLITDDSYNNHITNCWSDNAQDDGFNINNSHRNTISTSHALNTENDGFHLSQGATWNTIDACDSVSSGEHGIQLFPATYCSYNTISNNLIKASTECGIFLNTAYGNTVEGNTIEGQANHSIYLYLAKDNTLTGNKIRAGNRGIYLRGSQNNTITGGNIDYPSDTGIMLSTDSSFNQVTGVTITIVQNNEGIEVYGDSDWNSLVANTVLNSGGNGIHINGATNDYTMVVACTTNGNGGTNILDEGTNSQIHSCWNGTSWIT